MTQEGTDFGTAGTDLAGTSFETSGDDFDKGGGVLSQDGTNGGTGRDEF